MHRDKVRKGSFMCTLIVFSLHYINTKPGATRKNNKDPFEKYVYSEFEYVFPCGCFCFSIESRSRSYQSFHRPRGASCFHLRI
jgi:hypothetical protein